MSLYLILYCAVERNEPNEAGADMGADSRRGPGVRSGGRPEGRVTG